MLIELRDIHKHYGTIKANNGVSLSVSPGSIHGILGENGAGKSTLMKILSGYSRKTRGSIIIDGAPISFRDPSDSTRQGIGMLYQDPLDFPHLSVVENFMLGQNKGIRDRRSEFREKFEGISQSFNFDLDPDSKVESLTIGERQQLEILRLLALGVQVLILDEPTTGISDIQKKILFTALKKLTSEGKSVVLVSHKLEDIETLCDKVTVLRNGAVAGEMEKPFITNKLLAMMFGTQPVFQSWPGIHYGEAVLSMKGVSASAGKACLRDCDIVIQQGEVVGLAGLEGSGQGLFLRVASGLQPLSGGEIQLKGKKMAGKDYHVFKQHGVTFLPSSRLEEGLIPDLSIVEHFALQKSQKSLIVKMKEALEAAEEKIDIKAHEAHSEDDHEHESHDEENHGEEHH